MKVGWFAGTVILGELTTEVTEVEGVAVRYADDLAVAPNGKIYLSDASTRFAASDYESTLAASLLDIMEHSDNGRVIEFDPIVAETGEYRIWKHWISGVDAGKSEVIIDNLPGFPDNVHIGENGRYWVGLTAPRSDVLDDLSGEPFWRSVIQRLPEMMRPQVVPYGMVFAIDENGNVLENLQAPNGEVYATTGVAESKQHIYVTSLTAPFLARYKKSDLDIRLCFKLLPLPFLSSQVNPDKVPWNVIGFAFSSGFVLAILIGYLMKYAPNLFKN